MNEQNNFYPDLKFFIVVSLIVPFSLPSALAHLWRLLVLTPNPTKNVYSPIANTDKT